MFKKNIFIVAILLMIILFLNLSCMISHVEIQPIKPDEIQVEKISTPSKIHLNDGSMVVFDKGFKVHNNKIMGKGLKYDITRNHSEEISSISFEEITEVEYYKERFEGLNTIILIISNLIAYSMYGYLSGGH